MIPNLALCQEVESLSASSCNHRTHRNLRALFNLRKQQLPGSPYQQSNSSQMRLLDGLFEVSAHYPWRRVRYMRANLTLLPRNHSRLYTPCSQSTLFHTPSPSPRIKASCINQHPPRRSKPIFPLCPQSSIVHREKFVSLQAIANSRDHPWNMISAI